MAKSPVLRLYVTGVSPRQRALNRFRDILRALDQAEEDLEVHDPDTHEALGAILTDLQLLLESAEGLLVQQAWQSGELFFANGDSGAT